MPTTILCDGDRDFLKISDDINTAEPIRIFKFRGGRLHFPSTWSTANVTIHECDTENGVYKAAQSEDGTPAVLSSCVALTTRPLPSHLFAAHWIKLVSSVDNSASLTVLTVKS